MKIQLYTPHAAQREVHKSCNSTQNLFTIVISGRQVGKTLLAQNQALYWALSKHNQQIMWVSPTSAQALKVFRALKAAVENAPFFVKANAAADNVSLTFVNGSSISFKSARAEDNLRGPSIHYMIIDEAAFIKNRVVLEILFPMLNVKGKKCLIVTTPKGKNWVHKHYQKGKLKTPGYESFRYTYAANPKMNPEIIRIAKENLPEKIFRQEYLAEFVDGSTIFENIDSVCILPKIWLPKKQTTYFAGVDIGIKNDFTVFSVVDENQNLVFQDRFTNLASPELKARVKRNILLWKPKNTLIEVNGMGLPIFQDLKHDPDLRRIKINPFNTNNNNKKEIFTAMINDFSAEKVNCIQDETLKSELETIEIKITDAGNVTFSAAEGFHDDTVMSYGIARRAQDEGLKQQFNLKISRS